LKDRTKLKHPKTPRRFLFLDQELIPYLYTLLLFWGDPVQKKAYGSVVSNGTGMKFDKNDHEVK